MNESNSPTRIMHRRDLIKGVAAEGLGLAIGAIGPSVALAETNVSRTLASHIRAMKCVTAD